jgi:hypothetical protein
MIKDLLEDLSILVERLPRGHPHRARPRPHPKIAQYYKAPPRKRRSSMQPTVRRSKLVTRSQHPKSTRKGVVHAVLKTHGLHPHSNVGPQHHVQIKKALQRHGHRT